jgi:uncharacterized caspase-like protein
MSTHYQSEQFANGYALLIGVDENNVEPWALPDVAKDITALAKVLTHPERCAYPVINVKVLTGEDATRQSILDGLDWLHERIQADTSGNATAVVYYTGHGWRDEQVQPPIYYLIPYDMLENNIRSRTLRGADFANSVGALQPHRLLVILDCCHSGGIDVKELGARASGYVRSAIPVQFLMTEKSVSAADGDKGLEALGRGAGRGVLSSSQGEQPSYMRQDGQMSIFTYHLIEALTGHAQPKEGATEVLLSDVMGYVHRHVPQSAKADWNADQNPDYQVVGNFPIALLLGGKGLTKGQLAPNPLVTPTEEDTTRVIHRADTGGGAYIGGRVDTGGCDFVGRDRVIHSDNVRGDKVGGDKYTTGDITDSTVAIGRNAQTTYTEGLRGEDLVRLFAQVYRQIEARPDDPNVDKEELVDTVQKVEEEAAKGEMSNPNKVERWLKNLVQMAPDILDVTVACLTHPLTGVGTVIRKVAEKAKAKAGTD